MEENNKSEGIRLQKYLSEQGIMSRRAAEKAMTDGLIRINGKKVLPGTKINPDSDVIEYRGTLINGASTEKVYLMLNKPAGYVTTMSDDLGRKCVADLVDEIKFRVWPVGRLDYDSEGLLLMTNDGELTNRLTHPRHEIPKIYQVTLKGSVTEDQLALMKRPMLIDGYRIRPVEARIISDRGTSTIVEIMLREGRNRQIRKMCDVCGFDVKRLRRVAVGKVELGDLPQGKWRELTKAEKAYLMSGGAEDYLGGGRKFDTLTRKAAEKRTYYIKSDGSKRRGCYCGNKQDD
ncbi:MAG TPA: rRNA pseudouridine synthase [Clostridiales bacterium]|jgi:23S rRNA pseudouridine2605 synthase|nr:rRNA pseudouridine synthase [Clostridiales bacterium]